MSESGLGVRVELGPCRVVRDEKGKFTTYTLNFRIGEETHSFTSRYAKLYKFHESLLKNEEFQKSFAYNPPDFPPKAWFTDFTKPKHYRKRANKILKYFKILTSKPSILRNKQFQKGIDLPQSLQKLIKQIAKGLQSKHYIEKNYNKKLKHSPHSKSNSSTPNDKYSKAKMQQKILKHNRKDMIEPVSNFNNNKDILSYEQKQELLEYNRNIFKKDINNMSDNKATMNDKKWKHKKINKKTDIENEINLNSLELLLKNLENETDKMFVDIVDGIEIKEENLNNDYEIDDNIINNLNIFCIDNILPNHLINDKMDNKIDMKCVIDMDLFNRMNKNDLDKIDDIAFDIRDAIINACEISVN
eukprot:180117_1